MPIGHPNVKRSGGLEGRVVVVTGAGRGLGRGIAERFGREGSQVVVNARRAEAAQAVVDAIRAAGGTAIAALADVLVRSEVNRLFDEVVSAFGRVDILINNAGLVGPSAHFLELTDELFERFLATNVIGAFYCSERAGRLMARQRSGSIINLCSVVSIRPSRMMVAYTTSKAALDGFTRALALDLAPFGVRVNAVAPGIGWSPERYVGATAEEIQSRLEVLPIGRIGRPEDVAAACAYLASDDASFVTGQIHYVDGGLTTQSRPMAMDLGRFDPSSVRI